MENAKCWNTLLGLSLATAMEKDVIDPALHGVAVAAGDAIVVSGSTGHLRVSKDGGVEFHGLWTEDYSPFNTYPELAVIAEARVLQGQSIQPLVEMVDGVLDGKDIKEQDIQWYIMFNTEYVERHKAMFSREVA